MTFSNKPIFVYMAWYAHFYPYNTIPAYIIYILCCWELKSLDMKPFHTWFHTHPLELLWKPGYRSCMPDCVTCKIHYSHVRRKNCFASWWPVVLNTKCNAYHEKDVMWQATTRSISLLIVCWLLCNADKLSIPCVSHSVTRRTGELLGGRAQEAFKELTYSDLSLPLILLLTSSYPCMVRICNLLLTAFVMMVRGFPTEVEKH